LSLQKKGLNKLESENLEQFIYFVMNQRFIESLMHFFALLFLPLPGKKVLGIKKKLEIYIEKAGIRFSSEECLNIFETYSNKYFVELSGQAYKKYEDSYNVQKHLLNEAAINAQANLFLQERLRVVLSLYEFYRFNFYESTSLEKDIQNLSISLNIEHSDYEVIKDFIDGNYGKFPGKELLLQEKNTEDELEGEWIKQHETETKTQQKILLKEKIYGNLYFRYFENFNYLAFKYSGTQPLFLNDKPVHSDYFYSFRKNEKLQFEDLEPIDFQEIENQLDELAKPVKICLSGENLSFEYKSSHFKIQPFSFSEENGQLIGILGNNGVGKSSILKMISNQINPNTGYVCINGYNLNEYHQKLNSITGYVSTENLFSDKLSIYENLLIQGHLTLGNLSSYEIKKRVHETIRKFKLSEVAYTNPGMISDSRFTDFQLSCYRIAIEMIRNPYVLFLDEPMARLSYSDSRRLLSILKEETYSGKLIIISSQFPAAELFNMFDKIWYIDNDAHIIYSGDPSGSLSFFKDSGLFPYYVIQNRSEMVSPEDVIKIVETKKIDTKGNVSDERLVSPKLWYNAWKEKSNNNRKSKKQRTKRRALPITGFRLPGIEKQYILYLLRNLRVRFFNIAYLLFHLFVIPFVGYCLASFIKNLYTPNYTLGNNEYLPLYIFLSIIIMIFSGLLSSVEEIFHEKNRIKRDFRLGISKFSHHSAKITYLIMLSSIQVFWYVLIGNTILEIKGLFIQYFFTFLTVSVFGNLLGLILSASIKKLSVIYILIPFILLPNILFSGFLIPFDYTIKINHENKKIPLIAEFTPARYAYEALVTEQFISNPFNKYFYTCDKQIYDYRYIDNHILPHLKSKINDINEYLSFPGKSDSLDNSLKLLKTEINLLSDRKEIAPFDKVEKLNPDKFTAPDIEDVFGYLTYTGFLMENLIEENEVSRLNTINFLYDSLNANTLDDFRSSHLNTTIKNIVRAIPGDEMVIQRGHKLYKTGSRIYLNGENPFGRAHFFAPYKKIGNTYTETQKYNLSVIWIMNLLLYSIFLGEFLKKLLKLLRIKS